MALLLSTSALAWWEEKQPEQGRGDIRYRIRGTLDKLHDEWHTREQLRIKAVVSDVPWPDASFFAAAVMGNAERLCADGRSVALLSVPVHPRDTPFQTSTFVSEILEKHPNDSAVERQLVELWKRSIDEAHADWNAHADVKVERWRVAKPNEHSILRATQEWIFCLPCSSSNVGACSAEKNKEWVCQNDDCSAMMSGTTRKYDCYAGDLW